MFFLNRMIVYAAATYAVRFVNKCDIYNKLFRNTIYDLIFCFFSNKMEKKIQIELAIK